MAMDVSREPLGDGIDSAHGGRVAGLVDVAVTGAELEVDHRIDPRLRERLGEALPRRAQFIAFADHDERRRVLVAVTDSGERLRIRENARVPAKFSASCPCVDVGSTTSEPAVPFGCTSG